jgi:hypothetical protein
MTTDIFCFYLQNRLIQTSKTGGQQYSDTSPFSIPWVDQDSKAVSPTMHFLHNLQMILKAQGLVREEHSSLLNPLVCNEENKVL